MIPKIIHQIWIGNNPMPETLKSYIEGWKHIYTDYEFILWNDEFVNQKNIIPDFLSDVYFKNDLSCVFKSDILRFLIIQKYGGIYLDVDFECIKKLPDHFLNFNFLGGIQNNGETAIGFFASIQNDPLIEDIINNIIPSVEKSKENGTFCNNMIHKILGPEFFTIMCQKYFNDQNYFFFTDEYFYPYWHKESHRKFEKFSETCPLCYAVHHWAKSWYEMSTESTIKS